MTAVGPVAFPVPQPADRPAQGDAATSAREFEALFLSQTVDEMLKTVPAGIMGGGHAEEMWRSFLARAIADEIAGGGNTGIATSVEAAITGYGRREQTGG
jgi:peptidoglycan hydrolase FlgJ